MRIVIDMQGLQGESQYRGIGRYSKAFFEAFIRQSSGHEVYILLNMLLEKSALELQKQYEDLIPKNHILPFYAIGPVREVYLKNAWNIQTSELIREKMLYDIRADFVIITSLFEGLTDNSIISIGKYSSIPTASIFYDLIPSIYPEKFLTNPLKKSWYDRKLDSLSKSSILLAISESAAQEAVTYLNYDSTNIYPISSASDIHFTPHLETKSMQERFAIKRPFLLHASAYEERKNFEGLIEAFSLLTPLLRASYQLVLVCKLKPAQKEALEQSIDKYKLSTEEVILTNFISDDDLITLYHACHLFVFPSWHEGFGLPPLEAMSCGAATIGSNISSIPEVIGREDALFDPYNTQNIADKITEVLTQESFYKTLKTHAKVQAKKFSWDASAKKALAAVESHHHTHPPHYENFTVTEATNVLIDKIVTLARSTPRPLDSNLMHAAFAIEQNERTIRNNISTSQGQDKPLWQVEGPFDSSYSLALLNRETALALTSLGYKVLLHSTDGPGDFEPNKDFLHQHPLIATLYKNTFQNHIHEVPITSRNLYPPRVSDMQTPIKMLHHYAWEESAFPQVWVEDFNAHLTAMTCLSSHVEKTLIDNGVTTPMLTSGCGVDHWERIVAEQTFHTETKGFVFLHVSSCFPRKGADILLKAYAHSFTKDDDVTLIIKTFKNPHNHIEDWLKEAQNEHPSFPHVHIIYEDLSDAKLKALYEQCDILVAPSRAEGFGLPMAEAMLSGLGVITTAWGGQLDFCTEETSWLLDYHFARANSHFKLYDSVWAEPSATHLAELMQTLYRLPKQTRDLRAHAGRKLLLKTFKWTDVTQRLVDAAKALKTLTTPARIAWVSTWKSKCGIASYSEHLLSTFPSDVSILANHEDSLLENDAPHVHRCWHAGDGHTLDALTTQIQELNLDTLVIQFNYSFFDFHAFNTFIKQMKKEGKILVLMLHATIDSPLTPHKKLHMLKDAFMLCDKLFVHTPHDLNRLKGYGLVDNVALFPHGIVRYPQKKKEMTSPFVLASYGFFLPHKGLHELIDAVQRLHAKGLKVKLNMVNALYPVPISQMLVDEARKRIEAYGLENYITLYTDYLPDEESLTYLSHAHLVIFPYQETGESSSAAVRYGLASHTPVAVTPLDIFEDVQSASYTLSGTSPDMMAKSIEVIMEEISTQSLKAKEKQEEADRWSKAHHYSTLSTRLSHILFALHQKAQHR